MFANKGFTFIEVLLVVALIIVLTTSALGFYSRFLTENEVQNTTDRLVGQLRQAQIYAMSGKLNSNWGVNFGAGKITLYQGANYAARTVALDENFSVNSNVTISGFTEVNFARETGLPSATPTITISGSGRSLSISINNQGVASR